jgi:arsenite methyltransferase
MTLRFAFALAVTAGTLCAQMEHQQHHPPRDAAEYARILEDPSRDAWQQPHEVITALAIRKDEVIADLGAGSGYFSRRLAHHAAKVYAVDIDAKLLAMLKQNAPPNVETVLATPDDPKLPPASVDTVFICDVLHHIENRPAYFARLAAALKPGGRIVNIDFFKRDLPVGPPVAMKLSEAQVEKEFAAAGFRKVKQVDTLKYQYFLVFAR